MNVYSFLEELKSKEVQLNLNNGKLEVQAPEGVLTADLVTQLKSYKNEIIELLQQIQGEENSFEIPVATKKEYYPLSFSQNRLWVLDQFEQVGTVFNMAMHYWLYGAIDATLFEKAFKILVERHEILRTRFVYKNGQPYQQILQNTNEGISFETLNYSDNENPNEFVQAKAQEIAATKFDLEKDPLLKVALIKVSDKSYFLSLCIHHIISDEWSMNILVRDVITIYSGLKNGEKIDLQPLRIQFKDYASWELENIQHENASKQYWLQKLEGTLPVLELASDYTRPVIQTYNGNEVAIEISKQNSQQFHEILEKNGATLFMGVMSLVYTLLYKYSGQDDIILGAPVSGRKHADLEAQIGFYVNTLALRQNIDGNADFLTLLQQVKTNILNGYQHQSYPFDLLVNELNIQRDPSRSPLFDVMVVVQDQEKNNVSEFEGITIEEAQLEKTQSKYDLTFWFKENTNGKLSIQIEYNTNIYSKQTIQRFCDHLGKLLENILVNSTIPLNELTLIDETSIRKLEKFNATDVAYNQNESILDLFKSQVENTPNAIAVTIDDKELTYKELDEISNQLSHLLNVESETLIPICVDRSLEMIIGILAILKVGGAYVPIDPELPQSRISYMIENTEAAFVLTETKYASRFKIPSVNIDDATIYKNQSKSRRSVEINESSLAYVIYTSGSTGRPKGVKIDHAGIYNRLLWMKDYLGISKEDNILQKTNFSFDVSVWELFLPIICGAKLVFAKPLGHKDTNYLKKIINEKHISLMHFVPTMLSAFLMELTNEEKLYGLRAVICSGEALPANTVKQFQDKLPSVRLHNLYGPTEASIDVTAIDVTNYKQGKISIGKPIANTKIHIVDRKGNIQPIGVKGELLIAGVQVAKGYVNNADLTAQKFIDNPFDVEDKYKVYKTGDYAKWLPDGNIEFLGRIDNQVKLRGYRIELGEIESLLQANSGVSQAKVIVKEDFLLAYVTGKEIINIDNLRTILQNKLPAYMIPAHIQQLSKFPLTHSGKLDKSSLPIPEGISTKKYIAPNTEIEKQIARIWSELLLASKVGTADDFFELGGNSIKAIQFITKLKNEASLHVSIEAVFKNPVLKNLASQITTETTEISIPKVETQEDYELSKAQRGTWIQVQRQPDSPMFNIFNIYQLKGKLDQSALQKAFRQVIAHHESLRTIFIKKGVEPRQKILAIEACDFSVTFKNASQSTTVLQEFTNHIFDLNKGPLFKVTVVQNGAGNQELYFSIHHIISDEWSIQILVRDLINYYNAIVQGEEISVTPLPIQYKDYAAWQTSMLNSAQFEVSRNYWKNHLYEAPRIELASDRPRPAVMSNKGLQYNFAFSQKASEGLKTICSSSGSTLFMGVSALVYALLYRYTGQSDITLGTPVAGRDHAGLENQIGLYINTLALRAQFSGEDNFKKLLTNVKDISISGFAHQSYPFDVLVEELESDLQKNRAPLFDVVVILQNVELQFMKSLKMEGIEIKGKDVDLKVSKSDLRFEFIERETHLECSIEYNTDLYDEERIIRMGNHIEKLLTEILATPEVSMKELTYLGEEESATTDWFAKEIPTITPQYIHKTFENIVESYPEKTALIEESGNTNYRDLNEFANQLGNLMTDIAISSEDGVGVLLPSGKELVGSLLACFKTGATYVPLSSSFSLSRMEQAVSETGMKVLITDDSSWEAFKSLKLAHSFTHVLVFKASGSSLLGDLGLGDLDLITLDQSSLEVYKTDVTGEYTLTNHTLESYNKDNLSIEYAVDNSSYIFYSSGTTGKSKAIVGNQESIAQYVNWHRNTFNFTTETRVSQIASVTFDASLKDILTSLTSGSCLCIPSEKTKQNMVLLGSWLAEEKVTVLQTVPSLFRLLTNNLKEQNIALTAIEEVVLAGEKLYGRDVALWRSIEGHSARMSNLYGLTETTVLKSCYHIPETELDAGSVLPVGKSIDNSMIAVINDSGLSLWGEIGEVYIKSPYTTKGYLDAELTKNLFVQNPLVTDREDLVCKTGDIGRYDAEGNLEILGRIDDQIKLHGVRVELDGIRSALLNLENIGQVELIVHNDNTVDSLLCYYSGTEYDKSELRETLGKTLDRNSIPDYFMYLEEFPLTLNGKVDKRALPKPSELLKRSNYEAPKNNIEISLSTIWSALLNVPQTIIDRNDSFFDLGGSSLKAMQLITHVYKKHDVQLSIGEIFKYPELNVQATLIANSKGDTTYNSIPTIAEQDDYALSHAQRRTWLIEQQIEGVSPFNGADTYQLEGNLDIKALTESFTKLIERHESLRTIFILKDGEPRQKILSKDEVEVNIEIIDISASPSSKSSLVQELRQPRFDLSQWPLFRIKLLSYGANKYELVFIDHHIISDEWSMQILVRDLVTYYNGLVRNESISLAPLPIQYKDYAAWQASQIGSEQFEASRNYWKSHLADAPKIELASDRPRPAVMSHKGAQHHFTFSKEASAGLKELCAASGSTLFMGLNSLVYALLYRYTGQSDITLGTPVAGRDHADLENQIGLYLNTLALRAQFSGDDNFNDLVSHVKDVSLAGFNHQSYPFDIIIEDLNIDLQKKRSALFDVVVILQNVDLQLMDALSMEGLQVDASHEELKISKGDLRFQFVDRDGKIEGSIEYSTDLYDEERIIRMGNHIEKLLTEILATPEVSMKELTYLGEEESATTDWFAKEIPTITPQYIQKTFENIVESYPEKTALIEESGNTNYRDLNEFANQLGNLMTDIAISSEDGVGVLLPSGKELVGSLLACFKTGATYVPLSNSFSLSRMKQAVSETGMKVLITDDTSWEAFKSLKLAHSFTHVLVFKASGSSLLGDLGLGDLDLITLDQTSLEVYKTDATGKYTLTNHTLESYSKENLSIEYAVDNSSYIFYSSGTTGKSKAIVGNQESIAQYVNWHRNTFNFTTETRVSQIASVTFDASLKDILTSLTSGSCLCIPSEKTKQNMVLLGSWLAEEKVTVLQTVPSLFRLLTNNLKEQNIALTAIEEVVLAGEKLYGRDVALWRSIEGHSARMSNLYGLTETTVLKSCYHIPETELDAGSVLPVGKSIDNSMIAVINDSGLSLWGEIGEVYIKSPYTTKGYLDAELTKNLFVQNSLVTDREDLVCKTGDIGRYDAEGNLEILGRIDDQIKLHGVRVELDGIRSALLNLENIGQVELIVHNDNTVDSLLCYYSGTEYDKSELRETLGKTLDRNSIPDYFMYLEEFPLTLNGKVDKRALPKPSELLKGSNYEAPKGAVEESLSAIWAALLSIPQTSIGRNDSFFDLGGSSLKAIQLISRVYKQHEVQLSIGEIFNHATLQTQAALLTTDSKNDAYSAIEKVAEQDDYALSHAQRRTWLIEQQIEGVSPFNGVEVYRLVGNLEVAFLKKSFEKLIERHESLRTIFILNDGEPRQKILQSNEIVVDIETIDISKTPERRNALVEELRQSRFDLSQWPLFRIKLLTYEANVYDLVFVDHHIISDEWSMQILVRDLVSYYNGFIEGKEASLAPLPIQYKDYAAWQASQMGSEQFEASGNYWKSHLADAPRIELASDRPRPKIMSHEGSQYHFSFSEEISKGLKELCTEVGCTLFMGLNSLVYTLLYRYTGQSDITLGTPVAGRDHTDLENQIGLYLNTLALRAQFSGEDNFKEVLAHVKQVSIEGFNHQTYPFDLLVEELGANTAKNRSPLFDVVVILQNIDLQLMESLKMKGLEVSSDNEELKISKGDLRFQFVDRESHIEGNIEYSTALYNNDRIKRMVADIKNLLTDILEKPTVKIRKLDFLSEIQTKKIAAKRASFADDLSEDY